jgi:hypothetical protein
MGVSNLAIVRPTFVLCVRGSRVPLHAFEWLLWAWRCVVVQHMLFAMRYIDGVHSSSTPLPILFP